MIFVVITATDADDSEYEDADKGSDSDTGSSKSSDDKELPESDISKDSWESTFKITINQKYL